MRHLVLGLLLVVLHTSVSAQWNDRTTIPTPQTQTTLPLAAITQATDTLTSTIALTAGLGYEGNPAFAAIFSAAPLPLAVLLTASTKLVILHHAYTLPPDDCEPWVEALFMGGVASSTAATLLLAGATGGGVYAIGMLAGVLLLLGAKDEGLIRAECERGHAFLNRIEQP